MVVVFPQLHYKHFESWDTWPHCFLGFRAQNRVPGNLSVGVAISPLSLVPWTLRRPLQGSRLNEGILGGICEFPLSLHSASHVEGIMSLSRPNPLWISISCDRGPVSSFFFFTSQFLSRMPMFSPREGLPRICEDEAGKFCWTSSRMFLVESIWRIWLWQWLNYVIAKVIWLFFQLKGNEIAFWFISSCFCPKMSTYHLWSSAALSVE